jgi:hypothetical protein
MANGFLRFAILSFADLSVYLFYTTYPWNQITLSFPVVKYKARFPKRKCALADCSNHAVLKTLMDGMEKV